MHESSQVQRLHQELAQASQVFEEKIRELSMARRIGDSLKYARDVRRVFETILDTILEETCAENCSLMLIDHGTGELTIKAAKGQADAAATYYRIGDGSRHGFRVGEGVAGWVAQQGQPVSIPDVSQDSRFVPFSQSVHPIGSLLCQPMLVEDEVVGVVNLSHSNPRAFTDEDVGFMAIIAGQVAVTFSSVQIFDEMQQLNASLKAEVDRATEELRRANAELKTENAERRRAEEELRKAHDELESRVQERTAELAEANVTLKAQVVERERTEEALRESNRRLKEALDELRQTQQHVIQQERLHALGAMASGIAHDFNNALSPILGFSELLLSASELLGDQERTKRYLQTIHTAAQDAASVVKRLREFYRHRDRVEAFLPINLNRLVSQTISLTEPRWRGQALADGATVRVETDFQEVPDVMGNEAELREALTNLIFNAVDAVPEGGTITLRTCLENDRVALCVSDTGAGMTEEVRQRCMEPFFTTKGERGTGLGLAMVFGIVQRHNGTVDIQSKPGDGTTFSLRLPIPASWGASEERRKDAALSRSLRVLVVDDDRLVREVITTYLARDGHTFEVAANGREGLEKFQAGRFDLVVTDRAMPEMSGDQMAVAVKRIAPDVSVVMLTGFGDMMQASGEKPKGADFVVGKPVMQDTLRNILEQAAAGGQRHSRSDEG